MHRSSLLPVLFFLLLCLFANTSQQAIAEEGYELVENVPYRQDDELTEYMQERCRLDIYHPIEKTGFATVVWFHGGGLRAGNKYLPDQLREKGIAVVPVNYRLHPKVKSPAYIDDAAAAVAWVFKNIESYGGDPKKIFVSGHSAGGYQTSMIGLDKKWLQKYDLDANEIAGLIPFSGHSITHFTVRKEMGIDKNTPLIDDMAPLSHLRKDAPPILIITGDRELELLGRYEENAYMWRMLKIVGHPDVKLEELEGFTHGGMNQPAQLLLLDFMKKHSK
ncbi:Carboxylesterase NlhH [Polystyrenella longa]|uniref:Carboxylesterase NlhH n=1 Tax=Polystyrenella longa TaxID=2528007 RepID=A0A518CNX8_9PLAN|nr:alpha/beta hydrolase fold domain-containing protein [Polystyrenella longa]QDU80931.1 Carboxylesterase NlhH [Polystyrenella longa]